MRLVIPSRLFFHTKSYDLTIPRLNLNVGITSWPLTSDGMRSLRSFAAWILLAVGFFGLRTRGGAQYSSVTGSLSSNVSFTEVVAGSDEALSVTLLGLMDSANPISVSSSMLNELTQARTAASVKTARTPTDRRRSLSIFASDSDTTLLTAAQGSLSRHPAWRSSRISHERCDERRHSWSIRPCLSCHYQEKLAPENHSANHLATQVSWQTDLFFACRGESTRPASLSERSLNKGDSYDELRYWQDPVEVLGVSRLGRRAPTTGLVQIDFEDDPTQALSYRHTVRMRAPCLGGDVTASCLWLKSSPFIRMPTSMCEYRLRRS